MSRNSIMISAFRHAVVFPQIWPREPCCRYSMSFHNRSANSCRSSLIASRWLTSHARVVLSQDKVDAMYSLNLPSTSRPFTLSPSHHNESKQSLARSCHRAGKYSKYIPVWSVFRTLCMPWNWITCFIDMKVPCRQKPLHRLPVYSGLVAYLLASKAHDTAWIQLAMAMIPWICYS